MKIHSISIIAEGKLGIKLQELFLKYDLKVIMMDLSQDYAKQASDADLILEVVAEDIDLKKKVLKNCDAKCRRETILATTTANTWVTKVARSTTRPDKIIGLNFTKNPFEEKYLVQVVKGMQTSDETVQAVKHFLKKVEVTAVKLEENPGLVLDRVLSSIVNEAAVMYSGKLASKEDIDSMMKVCANWPMGPFEFADTLGVDKIVETLDHMSQQLGPRYQPCFLLRNMVDAGWLGKKTGRGFYVYS